jgi:hypothetical protein
MNSFDELEAPVARYFTHALGPKRVVSRGRRLRMHGRIKAPVWPFFEAEIDTASAF